MLEITEPARRVIRDAWRRGRVLVLEAPWRDYRPAIGLIGHWRDIDDDRALAGHMRVGDGEFVWLRPELLPVVRNRRIRIEPHSILGLWPGIAVRDLDPTPVFVIDRGGLWPRVRTPHE